MEPSGFRHKLRMSVVRDDQRQTVRKSNETYQSPIIRMRRKGDLMARMQSDVGEIENAVVSMLRSLFPRADSCSNH